MKIHKLLLDLDNCLYKFQDYPSLVTEIEYNITSEIKKILNIPRSEAEDYKKYLYKNFGGAPACFLISGFIKKRKDIINIAERINYVSTRIIQPDYKLRDMLIKINKPVVIFTNSTKSYAINVLNQLGILNLIEQIISIEDTEYYYKNEFKCYEILKAKLDLNLKKYLFVDDSITNIVIAKKYGLRNSLLCNKNISDYNDSIQDIYDLSKYLALRYQ